MSKTLNESMGEFMDFMSKYSDWDVFTEAAKEDNKDRVTINMDDITQASKALQDLLVKQLENEIAENNLITWEHDSDGDRPNYDNLIEWISLYYELREK